MERIQIGLAVYPFMNKKVADKKATGVLVVVVTAGVVSLDVSYEIATIESVRHIQTFNGRVLIGRRGVRKRVENSPTVTVLAINHRRPVHDVVNT